MQYLDTKSSRVSNNPITLLIGSFGAGNVGDELILWFALDEYPNSVVMTANADKSETFVQKKITTVRPFPVGIRSWMSFLSDRSYRLEVFSLNTKINQVVFPGGGLFKNNTKAICLWFFTVLWCRLLLSKVPIIFTGQGIDWPEQFWLQRLTFWAFSQSENISVRDEISAKNLAKLGLNPSEIFLGMDRVERSLEVRDEKYQRAESREQREEVKDESLEVRGKKIEKRVGAQHSEPDKKKIKMVETKHASGNKNSLREPQGTYQRKKILINAAKPFNYQHLIKKIEQNFGLNYELFFIAFDPSDLGVVSDNFKGEVLQPKSFTELQEIFSGQPICIGQRFHFLIIGQKFGSKVFLLEKPYAPKTTLLAEKYGIEIF